MLQVVDKGDNHIKESDFCIMVHRILSIETEQCLTLFKKIDVNCKGYISYGIYFKSVILFVCKRLQMGKTKMDFISFQMNSEILLRKTKNF